MPRKLSRILFAVAATVAITLGTQTAAQAAAIGDEPNGSYVVQSTATGRCEAHIVLSQIDGTLNAYGWFLNDYASWSCTGWLERSTDGGIHWYMVSGTHTVASDPNNIHVDNTAFYYDATTYFARACFHLNFSGAATHCTRAR
jgi:hypothetical protein